MTIYKLFSNQPPPSYVVIAPDIIVGNKHFLQTPPTTCCVVYPSTYTARSKEWECIFCDAWFDLPFV